MKLDVPAHKGSLNFRQLVDVFNQVADMPDIAFGYKDDGCYARAHIMGRRMMDAGLDPGKTWAFGAGRKLTVSFPDGAYAKWNYHMAVSLRARMARGSYENFVIDPSIFDAPVTLAQWGGIMKADMDHVYALPFNDWPEKLGDRGAYAPGTQITADSDRHAAEKMREYIAAGPALRTVFATAARAKIPDMPVAGKTWKAASASSELNWTQIVLNSLKFDP